MVTMSDEHASQCQARTPGDNDPLSNAVTRDFTVAVFVVAEDSVLLHRHKNLGIWLPPGGHIERAELPDEAAIREVEEEAELAIELIGSRGLEQDYPGQPQQLVRPEGIQLEDISAGHQHIDLIYFARPRAAPVDGSLPLVASGMRWVHRDELGEIELTQEVIDWCRKAVDSIPAR